METVSFPPDPRSAQAARRFVRDALVGFEGDLDTVLLLVSELVTNAVLHTQSVVSLTIALGAGMLRVSVADNCHDAPVHRAPGLDAVGGRGMGLVQTLASGWGVDLHPGNGKTVWFELASA